MSILIVGAGAAGGYVGAQLVAAGRDVTFLVHAGRLARLTAEGLHIRGANGVAQAIPVDAVTADEVRGPYEVVLLAVRSDAVPAAIADIVGAVGAQSRIVPLVNGMRHLSLLTKAFGEEAVLGAEARLAVSMLSDGVIEEVVPGIDLEIGQLDGGDSEALWRTAAELGVANLAVKVRSDVVAAMWEKFAFITSAAVLTCLIGENVGTVNRTRGGPGLAESVLTEVAWVAEAEGYALAPSARSTLQTFLTDTASVFGPSMFRDMRAGRPVEVGVLTDMADRARSHGIPTPLLDAAVVVVDLHNARISALPGGRGPR